jgi:hypothetical protein
MLAVLIVIVLAVCFILGLPDKGCTGYKHNWIYTQDYDYNNESRYCSNCGKVENCD